jgi:hypothetical protein
MKTRDEYKQAILKALGNPSSGLFVDYLDTIVDAVVGLDKKAGNSNDNEVKGQALPDSAKETRIVEAVEKR